MIQQKIQHSLAFRLPVLYRRLLGLQAGFIKTSLPEKEAWDISMVMLCGSKEVGLLQQSLKSIYDRFARLPHIYLFTDYDLPVSACRKNLAWFPECSLTITSAAECVLYHENKHDNLTAQFARSNPMGLKFAAILQIAEMGNPVLYADTDVLWFKNPYAVIENIRHKGTCRLNLSIDFQPAYDRLLIEAGKLEKMYEPPFYCAGILFIRELTVDDRRLIDNLLPTAAQRSGHFTEQTLFAALQKKCGPSGFGEKEFAIVLDDKYKLLSGRNEGIIARHYIGPVRHLFWRDAFFYGKK